MPIDNLFWIPHTGLSYTNQHSLGRTVNLYVRDQSFVESCINKREIILQTTSESKHK